MCLYSELLDCPGLGIFTLGLLKAELAGKCFIYRTAASFVPVRSSVEPRPLLTRKEIALGHTGGLIITGSYIPRTTAQLQFLLETGEVEGIEFQVPRPLNLPFVVKKRSEGFRFRQLSPLKREGCRHLYKPYSLAGTKRYGKPSYRRNNFIGAGWHSTVDWGSSAVYFGKRWNYISDIATKALNVKRALVLGQVLPGVPVWENRQRESATRD